MATEAIRIGNPEIEITLRRHAGARRMVLRVSQHGRSPVLTLPHGVSIGRARAFLSTHEAWLRGHLATRSRPMVVTDGSVLPFRGEELTIRVDRVLRFAHEGSELVVPARGAVGPRVSGWLREAARADLVAASERHAARLGVRIGRITLRDPRSRWGSCTHAAGLMYSWRLVMAPPAVLDYVAAHEVAHIAELNHSPAFWDVVAGLMPGYTGPRGWLRQNGSSLHLIDFGTGAT